MSSYEKIQARIAADEAADDAMVGCETFEGARADIVGEILKIAERWQLKAQEWPPEEHYVHLRAIVCEEILDTLDKELYDDEEDGA